MSTDIPESHNAGQPLGLGSSEGLGPLPPGNEPWCFAYTSANMKEYALAEVRRAVSAERERCAKVCEAEHVGRDLYDEELDDSDLAYNNAVRDCAAAVRRA